MRGMSSGTPSHPTDPADLPPLGDDEIHVWTLAFADDPAPRVLADAARDVLGRLLQAYAGLAAAPALERSEFGKPHAPAAGGVEFNLSHSGPCALLAFARKLPLGIDLERVERRVDPDEIARRFFDAREAEALGRLPAEARRQAFLELWTRKEAVLKALGRGLAFGLDRLAFAVTDDGGVGALQRIAADGGMAAEWNVHALECGADFAAAIAWRGPSRSVRRFDWAQTAATFSPSAPSV